MQQQQDTNQSNTSTSQNNCQEQEIQQNVNTYDDLLLQNDINFGICQEKIQFLNYENYQIKIVPVQDPQSQLNALLYLTIFSQETAVENLKYNCIINFQEEYQKQRYLQDVFEDLELKEIGTTFAEYFSSNSYSFEKNNKNENCVQLLINNKMVIGKKEKTIHFKLYFEKQDKQQKQQQQNKQQENFQQIINENFQKQNEILEKFGENLPQILKNQFQKLYQQQQQQQEQQSNLLSEIKNIAKEQLIQVTQEIMVSIKDKNQIQNKQIQEQQQNEKLQKYFENKEKNLYNIKEFILQQFDFSYEYFEKTCYKLLAGSRYQLFQVKNKLQNVIQLFNDPKKILCLSIMLPEQFDNKYNPQQILKANINDINRNEFLETCLNKSNCLILVKVQETEHSEFEIYGGYAPDSKIFSFEGYNCKTEQNQYFNLPFTFDLNQNIKRCLINQSMDCYDIGNDIFFEFCKGDLSILINKKFSFAQDDYSYRSQHKEENFLVKRYNYINVYDIEVEVIQLF